MRVILLQNIKGVGRMGDVKNVADGYGRNFLISRGLAKIATEGTVKEAEILKKKAEMEDKLALEKAKEVSEKAKNIVLEFTKKASKTGKLFASLAKEEVAGELSRAMGAKIGSDAVDFREHGEHIKQEGEHIIEVKLAPGIKIDVKVVIRGDK